MRHTGTDDERFARLYGDHGRDVLAYALRRAAGPEDAADVVAETFLTAWRRLPDVPPDPEARLWLYGVARRILAKSAPRRAPAPAVRRTAAGRPERVGRPRPARERRRLCTPARPRPARRGGSGASAPGGLRSSPPPRRPE